MNHVTERISDEIMAEQWFGFVHGIIEKLQSVFRESDLTQKDVARALGKQPAVISRCLRGQQNMTVRTMFEIARALGYRLEISFRPLNTLKAANLRHQPHAPRMHQPLGPSKNSSATAGRTIFVPGTANKTATANFR